MSAPNSSYDPVQVTDLQPEEIDAARDTALTEIAAAGDLDALADVRTRQVAGRGAPLVLARRELGALPPQARADAGKRLNAATRAVTEAYEARLAVLTEERDARVLVDEAVDVTVPAGRSPRGARHPLSAVVDRVSDVFVAMGYEVAEGPEAEHGWYNFDALNTPADHPSRELQDTLYLEPTASQVVLRTQTSPVQVRSLLDRPLPVYVICPGRVFRADTVDATHLPVFSQVEGLAIDEGLTMADLRGTLDAFAAGLFADVRGGSLRTRLRPHFFPFTEPSAEVDLQCFGCGGDPADPGCRICSGEGWIEWGGCGMVDPAVLTACGVDPERYTGFAFGMGLERTAMALHNIRDIRELIDGDVRFALAFAGAGEL
ncbi:MAG TPA: phenylalanine--tRNA ligase subunit alpha [Frankiaceae bacterium]|nr:phenylalanine--tRNA ligase subunit alpha [Frankiaceae bacterium]